jgi:very-short-patch-repair endonuclease
MVKKYDKNDFLFDAKKVHGDRYDYSLVEYKNKTTKVKILCKDHTIFEQSPSDHVLGRNKNRHGMGCPKCRNRKTQDQFIIDAKKVHGEEYDYSLVKYINTTKKVKIICKEHGIFEQLATHHISGSKCSKCQGVNKDSNSFILESINVHDFRYDYSLVDYINNRLKVKIICKEHGIFEQIPKHHLSGSGCPNCKNKGENIIQKFLKENNLKYKRQKTFDGCNHKKKLQFDFYLTKYNTCIEFDGIQHYESIGWFGGDKAFESSKIRDEIKNNFCLNNNIKLIRIRYDENILDKLSFLINIYP